MRKRSGLIQLVSLAFALQLVFGSARAGDEVPAQEYRPGRGWQVPGTNLQVGGYATVSLNSVNDTQSVLALDDLSLILHWEGDGKFRFLSEFTLENPLTYVAGSDTIEKRSYLAMERLYVDYLNSDKLSFRFGRFLTPIGRWNGVHAGPLEWTTSRPLVTERSFPTNATGVMAFGTVPAFGRGFDYSVYAAVGEDWRPDPRLDPFEEAYGVHVTAPVTRHGELGISVASFEQRSSPAERRELVGLDYSWAHNRFEIDAEAAYRFSEDGGPFDERGFFLQGVAPLSPRVYAIGRFEFYDPAGPQRAVNLWLLGVAFKPSPAWILKFECREGSEDQAIAPDSVLASVSILF